ncbi:MAG: hypothetical protein M1833_002272 [Piccolia ochrophora]|nr:MAG: hypothetical protein M1833_002272 [Piccolia ochrophora]
MVLVNYSDSETSDVSDTEAGPTPPPKAPTPGKPSFQKVVDRSNPHKIRVTLPTTADTSLSDDASNGQEPPAKRARTGGGAFSGFNALLPAPKRTGPVGSGNGLSGRKGGLGAGVNLKTGAEPAFSREPQTNGDYEVAEEKPVEKKSEEREVPVKENGGDPVQSTTMKPSEPAPSNVEVTQKARMFRPLSVARKPQKKKKPAAAVSSPTDAPPKPTPAPKTSLFSFGTEEPLTHPVTTSSTTDYEPLVYTADRPSPSSPSPPLDSPLPTTTSPPPPSGPQTLSTIASDLNLSAAAKRQLFGRAAKTSSTFAHDQPSSSSAPTAVNIINFNTDREYAANEVLRAAGDTVQHNPVRAIAPGKHSLQQLVNAASSQRDALEEQFASGRRNKKEAGSKYGW